MWKIENKLNELTVHLVDETFGDVPLDDIVSSTTE